MEEALERSIAAKDWKNAAIHAGNLSELQLALGKLAPAEARAQEAVAHADSSGDAFMRLTMRTAHADALRLRELGESERGFALAPEGGLDRLAREAASTDSDALDHGGALGSGGGLLGEAQGALGHLDE